MRNNVLLLSVVIRKGPVIYALGAGISVFLSCRGAVVQKLVLE